MNSSVAIILINWNNSEYTIECIKSLNKTSYRNKKIFVIDNNSNDNSVKKIKNLFSNIDITINKENLGFTGGNNVGIKKALKENFDFIMMLNNDTIVDSKFIEPLISSFDKNTGAVQPKILNYPDTEYVWSAGGDINYFFGTIISKLNNKKNKKLNNKNNELCKWISGCCFFISSSALKNVGFLDEKFFVYYEDVDLSLRLTDLNYNLKLINDSIIYHHEGASWKSNKKSFQGTLSPVTHYLRMRNHLYLIKKHKIKFNMIGVALNQFLKIFSYLIYFILRLRFYKLKMMLKGVIDSFKY